MNKEQLSHYVRLTIFISVLFFGMNYLNAAWSDPTGAPPSNNTEVPINVGSTGQTKTGNLWIQGVNGSGVSYANGLIVENGYVGLGSVNPQSRLHVLGTIRTEGAPGTWSGIDMFLNGNTQRTTVYNDSRYPGSIGFDTPTLVGGELQKMVIRNSGNIGIGTQNPQSKLDVAGEVRISSTGVACSSSLAGGIRYVSGAMQYCNGTSWFPFSGSGSIPSCADNQMLRWSAGAWQCVSSINPSMIGGSCSGTVNAPNGTPCTFSSYHGEIVTCDNGVFDRTTFIMFQCVNGTFNDLMRADTGSVTGD